MVSEPRQTVTVTVGPARPRLVTVDQVREHIGSNSTDTDELVTRLIEEADAEVVSRYGPHRIDGPATEVHPGGSFRLFPHREVKENSQGDRDGRERLCCAIPRRLPDLVRGPDAGAAVQRFTSPRGLGESAWSSTYTPGRRRCAAPHDDHPVGAARTPVFRAGVHEHWSVLQ